MTSLPSLRRRIDRLDQRLLRLLNQRAELALRVGRFKKRRGLPVFDSRREEAVVRQVARANRGPLSHASIRAMFLEILRQSRRLEASIEAGVARPAPSSAAHAQSRKRPVECQC